MKLIARPIGKWPGEHTQDRKRHRFGSRGLVDWTGTVELLARELRQLGCTDQAVLQLAVEERDLRLDGWIRANARPSHPGVILSFDSKHGPLSYPCDRFTDWQANVRAIALALEALRKVDRYGVTRRGEQYTGWKKIPASTGGTSPETVLAEHSGLTRAEVAADLKAAYRRAVRRTHPDRGGDASAFAQVTAAASFLGVR